MKRLFTIVCIFSALTATAQIDSYQGIGSFLFLGDKIGESTADTARTTFETRRLVADGDTANSGTVGNLMGYWSFGPGGGSLFGWREDGGRNFNNSGAITIFGEEDSYGLQVSTEDEQVVIFARNDDADPGLNSLTVAPSTTVAKKVVEYETDVSADYTVRSLVDKGYVDALISVAGSNGQIIYNNAGAYAGNAAYTVDPTNYLFTVTGNSAATNTTQNRLVLATNSTGTPTANFGGALLFRGKSNTTADRDMARISANWSTATDASRSAALLFATVDGGGSLLEKVRIASDGKMGLNTTNPISRLANTSVAISDGITTSQSVATGNGLSWTNANSSYTAGFENTNGSVLLAKSSLSTSTTRVLTAVSGLGRVFNATGDGAIDMYWGRIFGTTTTQATNYFAANSTGTNVNVGLVPKGSGAIVADIPDATATGGNARGLFAVDLQINRLAATEVASGTESAILGGQQNTASGNTAAIIGGFQSTASGAYCFVQGYQNTASTDYTFATGANALAADYGQEAHASGSLAAAGDAQVSRMVLRKAITGAGAQELYANGTNQRCRVPSGRAFNATVQLVATCDVVGNGTGIAVGETYIGTYEVGIKNNGGESALVGTVQNLHTAQADTGMSTASVSITADNTNDALSINFTPPSTAGTTTVINVVATVHWTQVGF